MEKSVQSSVVFCGKSKYFDIFAKELVGDYDFLIQLIDPELPDAIDKLDRQNARLLVYDKGSTRSNLVTEFLLKNPEIPVVGLSDEAVPEVEITFRQYSRIETSGLPQILQVLENTMGWLP